MLFSFIGRNSMHLVWFSCISCMEFRPPWSDFHPLAWKSDSSIPAWCSSVMLMTMMDSRHEGGDEGGINLVFHICLFFFEAKYWTNYVCIFIKNMQITAASSRNRAIGFPCKGMEIWPRRSEFHARNAWKSDQVHGIPTDKEKQQFLNFHTLPRNQF